MKVMRSTVWCQADWTTRARLCQGRPENNRSSSQDPRRGADAPACPDHVLFRSIGGRIACTSTDLHTCRTVASSARDTLPFFVSWGAVLPRDRIDCLTPKSSFLSPDLDYMYKNYVVSSFCHFKERFKGMAVPFCALQVFPPQACHWYCRGIAVAC